MTAHELARELLEGPDWPTGYERFDEWEEVEEVTVIDTQDFAFVNLS